MSDGCCNAFSHKGLIETMTNFLGQRLKAEEIRSKDSVAILRGSQRESRDHCLKSRPLVVIVVQRKSIETFIF
jgi:hypothetical protein